MLEAGVYLRPPFFWLKELFERVFRKSTRLRKIRSAMHLNNPVGSSSNLSGADLLAIIAAALRLLTPPGSRNGVRRKADHEQAGIGEPPPSLDARRSFVRLAASNLISKSAWRFFLCSVAPVFQVRRDQVCLVFAGRFLTAQEPPRHSWMLDVAEKMFGGRSVFGFRDNDAVAQLRGRLQQSGANCYVDADNHHSGTGLRSGSIDWRCVHTGDICRDPSQYGRLRVLRTG